MVSSCEGCQLGLDYKPHALPHGKIESVSPWDVVSIGIMGPFISGRKGEIYISIHDRLFLLVSNPNPD